MAMKIDPDKVRAATAQRIAEREATETGDRSPAESGTVTGWRAWRVGREPDENGQVLLNSVTYGYFWVPNQRARASCERCDSLDPNSRECTPGESCGCGFYTAKTLPHLREMGYSLYQEEYEAEITVVGKVANWGKVIEGTQGWRAEYAYPVALYVPFEAAAKIAKPLQDTYGVPVKLLNLLDPDAKPERARKLADFRVVNKQVGPKFIQEYRQNNERSDD